jgi:hypothetical protein
VWIRLQGWIEYTVAPDAEQEAGAAFSLLAWLPQSSATPAVVASVGNLSIWKHQEATLT